MSLPLLSLLPLLVENDDDDCAALLSAAVSLVEADFVTFFEATINEAIQEMNKRGITGKDTTPFLLARIAEQTKGESLDTNIKLVLNNAKLAAEIAVELCKR